MGRVVTSRELQNRIERLDSFIGRSDPSASVQELSRHVVSIMAEVEDRGIPDDEAELVTADAADATVARSVLLRTLRTTAPWLFGSPCPAADQRWIATQRTAESPIRSDTPGSGHFVPPDRLVPEALVRRPLMAGLCTSTAHDPFPGMWEQFLAMQAESTGTLWPYPWKIWQLSFDPACRILSIDSARSWVGLIEQHAAATADFIVPDWVALAERYDALHLSPAAVCAIDGMAFASQRGVIRPAYVTVETTLWLRWCFTGTRLLRTERSPTPAMPRTPGSPRP